MSVSLGLTVLQIKHNVVKNPNWSNLWEAYQLAIYKHNQIIWNVETAVKQIHGVLRVGSKPGTYELEVQYPNHSAMQPIPCYVPKTLSILPQVTCNLSIFLQFQWNICKWRKDW